MRTPQTPGSAAAPAPAVGDADNEWKCGTCGEMMGPSATKHCTACASAKPSDDQDEDGDGDEDAKALKGTGLLGKTRGDTRRNLTAFAKAILRATATTTADDAQVKAKLGAEARTELATARDSAAAAERDQAKASVIAGVTAAVRDGKLSIANCSDLADFMDSETEGGKVRAALSASMPDPKNPAQTIAVPQTLETVTAAFQSANYTAKDAKRIGAYLGGKGNALPTTHREPPPTRENVAAVAIDAASARRFGLTPETVAKYLNVTSVADLPPAQKGA